MDCSTLEAATSNNKHFRERPSNRSVHIHKAGERTNNIYHKACNWILLYSCFDSKRSVGGFISVPLNSSDASCFFWRYSIWKLSKFSRSSSGTRCNTFLGLCTGLDFPVCADKHVWQRGSISVELNTTKSGPLSRMGNGFRLAQ